MLLTLMMAEGRGGGAAAAVELTPAVHVTAAATDRDMDEPDALLVGCREVAAASALVRRARERVVRALEGAELSVPDVDLGGEGSKGSVSCFSARSIPHAGSFRHRGHR